MDPASFRRRLLAWYRKNARKNLPWRKTSDPYRIWVSETMLQQTQVATVIPYYQRFLEKFPSVQALADAPVTQVLDVWSGLGYYSRAKNLHRAAEKICREHDGALPKNPEELLHLPGVGRTTAGAIASIAYDRPAPILDGNVIRVLCRYFGIQEDPKGSAVQRKLWEISERLVPSRKPGDFNQAMMECGALVCTPRQPRCDLCPLAEGCAARRLGKQEEIPVSRTAVPKKKISYLCGILERNGEVLLARRPLTGLLPGLWEFPGGERQAGETDGQGLSRRLKERLGIRVRPMERRAALHQTLSHRELEIRAFSCRWTGSLFRPRWYLEAGWFSKAGLGKVSLTAGMRSLAQRLFLFCLLPAAYCLLLAGCGTTTASVPIDREELRQAQEFYQVKAKRHTYNQAIRVRTVGERLLAVVPKEVRLKDSLPSIGILLDDLTAISGRVFGISDEGKKPRACLIAGVVPGSPADRAGIRPGDLILKVGARETPTIRQAVDSLSRLKPGNSVSLALERDGLPFERRLEVGAKPYPVTFNIEDDASVNASAMPGQITVTTGLLRFINSDDELAVVMGHELAHLTQGHYVKRMGPGLIAGTIGVLTGAAVDIILPGAGDAIGQAATAPFSIDFEREADAVGLLYTYLAGYRIEASLDFWDRFATELPRSISKSFFSTHPTSPERLLRLQKTIDELRANVP